MKFLETERLELKHFNPTRDAEFIFRLVNEPSWIKNIGNRNVNNASEGAEFIKNKLLGHHEQHGYGFYMVFLKENNSPIGICGLVKRDPNEDADLGFAFIPESWRKGYAYEASVAVRDYSRDVLKFKRLLGITIPSNTASIKTLEKLGMKYLKNKVDANGEDIKVFEMNL